ncbi:MAG: hypothetical protein NTV51_13125 [Verrucomicrobia bacterium]|nr:hypothetical protein [Verrucomicrobiota bacterium]
MKPRRFAWVAVVASCLLGLVGCQSTGAGGTNHASSYPPYRSERPSAGMDEYQRKSDENARRGDNTGYEPAK